MSAVKATALWVPKRIVAEYDLGSSTLSNSVENTSNIMREVGFAWTCDKVEAVHSWKVLELSLL